MDKQELEKLIKEKEYLFLKEKLEKTNEVDIAELLEPLDIHTTLLIFRMQYSISSTSCFLL
jgi:magnesium transporter